MDRDRASFDAFVSFLATPLGDGRPFVLETKHALSLHFDHLATQSFMSLKAPDRLVLDYTRAMMGFLLIQPQPRHISMIGLGGGSLAKYCYRRLPDASIVAVEISPDVVALRDTFRIPADDERFRVICADGADYVRDAGVRSDAILLDAYVADGMPEQCVSAEFFAACRDRLTQSGVLAINFADDDPALPRFIERLEAVFGSSYSVFGCGGGGNYIALGWMGPRDLPSVQALLARARSLECAGELGLCSMVRRLKDGERFDWRRFVWDERGTGRWIPDTDVSAD